MLKVWKNLKGDEHFHNQRQRADNATGEVAAKFYRMMQEVGDEMQAATSALYQSNHSEKGVRILDLCMAPGGYTASALKYNPTAKAVGITLCTQPGHDSFSLGRLFISQTFGLVFCDGQVLRTQKRPEYREPTEASRLMSSQFILALQRIRHGGTLIVLLYKIESFNTIELLYVFSQFSDVEEFKPLRKHAIRSTFYLIAKNVQPGVDSARLAFTAWKLAWWDATFGGEQGLGERRLDIDDGYAQETIDSVGDRFTALARPIWKIPGKTFEKITLHRLIFRGASR
jgi:23S rRNA U2552 (ribose-2'-O)-methylase RlmE/FtsJ